MDASPPSQLNQSIIIDHEDIASIGQDVASMELDEV